MYGEDQVVLELAGPTPNGHAAEQPHRHKAARLWLRDRFEHAEGLIELRACPNKRGEGRVESVFSRDPDLLQAFVDRWNGKAYGVYVGCLTRKRERGTAEDALEAPALWVDIDRIPKAEARKALDGAYMPPSAIVDSGRGLHAWWFLDEPAEASQELVELLRGLRRIFAGDPAVCDLARIMRLPGTENTKYGEPLPVRVVRETGRRYSLDDIKDWITWQRELLGEPVDPFTAAADKLGVKPTLDVEQALASMEPGVIHETQLRVSASLAKSGVPEDGIVATLLEATRLAAGEGGRSWDWRKEERGLREMIRGARKKFEPIDLAGKEKRKAETHEAAEEKMSPIVRAARVAMEAWGSPLITVDGELWTYAKGAWKMFDSPLEHSLKVHVQGAVEALGLAPVHTTLNGAYRWIHERPELVRHGVQWDAAGVVVGQNGALDVATGKVGPHRQEHYASRSVACPIELEAECPLWMTFLRESLPEGAGPTLQEWFGAALVRGKTRETTKGLIVYGPSRTGKTQVTEVLRALLGGNTCGLGVRQLAERFGMQPLIGSSGWVADDAVGQREKMDAENYKIVVTGESRSIERKNKTSLEVSFDMPVLLTMNNFPVVRDSSDAVYNRTLVLPMTREWGEGEAKPIAKQVVAEELSGVLNWALEGWKRLKQRGRFDPPKGMLAAVKDFKGLNNPMGEFLELCIEKSPIKFVMGEDFRRIFSNWLQRELMTKDGWSAKAIALALQNSSLKVAHDKVKAGRIWVGIAFTEAALAFEERSFGQAEPKLANLNHDFTKELHERHGTKPDIETRF